MIRIGALLFLFLTMSLATVAPARAAESYDNCTGFITSLPAVISTQGTWCLKQDLTTAMTSGNAITIHASNVTVDCNDFKIGGLAAGTATETYGIAAHNLLNITVRHCNIRGFFAGAALWGEFGGGHVIEDSRFDGNTYIGVLIAGDGSTVRRNRVLDTGGSTAASANGGAVGIAAQYSPDVLDNTVSGVTATSGTDGDATGISMLFNHAALGSIVGSSVKGNRVRGLFAAGSGSIAGFGSFQAEKIVLQDNDFVGDASAGSTGIVCYSSTSHARNNMINGFATGISVCADDGANIVAP